MAAATGLSFGYLASIGLEVPALGGGPVRGLSAAQQPSTRPSAGSAAAKEADSARKAAKVLAPSATQKLRVLALHGHAQSASRFKGKIAAVTKEVKSLAEFQFVDAPFPLSLADENIEEGSESAFTWLDIRGAGRLGKGCCDKYAGVEQSFASIASAECDGIVAFSMGAAVLASLLCHPKYGAELRGRLRFAALLSGFIPVDPELAGWFEEVGTIEGLPTFHCIGRSDEEIAPDRSEALATKFEGAVVHRHDGGHVVPASVRKDFKAFLAGLPV